ncbi:hypothetical protein D3273_01105 [Lichenibacterium minor]|uniref:Uncharacterized protein n=1 Tax=Lichenibacterium minor TaxID=2316528 RepID=A0A4Q2UEZ0_9HYPH|nr:hypothetical protein [Lichenibacterium minor]RYC33881.1 hypothetical protein D3273_01105 [Lichenibacterium minor]
MFYFKAPIRPDEPESRDPAEVEFWRRLLDHGPGPIPKPIQTVDQIRDELAELAERGAVSARALTLSEAGFRQGVRVVVVHDLGGGIDRIEPFGKAIQAPLEGAEAEHFRPLGEAEIGPENVDCDRKDTTGEVLPTSAVSDVEIVGISDAAGSPSEGVISVSRIVVKSETPPQPQQKLQRARTSSKPNPNFIFETGLIPKTRPKADSKSKAKATARAKARIKALARTKAKSKPKRERKLTISRDERAEAELCFFMAEALGCPFNMKADLNPGHLDDLSVEERIAFCLKIVGNLLAYARGRCIARGMPFSWWPPVWGWVRESDPWTNLKEHVHLVFYAPEDERRRMVKLMEEKRKATNPKVKRWCPNAKFARIHPWEHWTGSKFKSAFGYFVKMANPQDYHSDSTIWYKKSGFITGPRIKFSPFLLDPDRVEAHRIDVQALTQLRDNDRVIMRRSGSEPAKNPRSLLRAQRSAPSDVHAEIVPVDVPATPAPAQVLVTAAVEPEPIEPATFLTPGSAGPVHRDETEHSEMDVVEVETRLAAPAEPVPIPREPAAAIVEVPVEADAMELIEAVTLAVPAAIDAGAIPAVIVSPDVPAEPGPTSPSHRAVIASLAVLGRSVARNVMAGAARIASRLGSRSPPPSPTTPPSALCRPRAPLYDRSAFIAAGAFFGAPDVQSIPW